jgi:hypothetical protein
MFGNEEKKSVVQSAVQSGLWLIGMRHAEKLSSRRYRFCNDGLYRSPYEASERWGELCEVAGGLLTPSRVSSQYPNSVLPFRLRLSLCQ